MKYTQFKVMGERNSGTNFAAQLIAQNYGVPPVPRISSPEAQDRIRHMRRFSKLAIVPQRVVREQLRNDNHGRHIPVALGWKHAKLNVQNIRRFRGFEETLIICIVRHPGTWLHSVQRYPVHSYIATPDRFSKFIRTPWLCLDRDEVTNSFLPNPCALWVEKNRSYDVFSRRYPNIVMLRHEELLRDPEAELARLPIDRVTPALDLPVDNARAFRPEEDTNYDYQARLNDGVWKGINRADRLFIVRRCQPLISKLGFAVKWCRLFIETLVLVVTVN